MGLRFQHPAPVPLGEMGNVGWREEINLAQQVGGPARSHSLSSHSLAGCGLHMSAPKAFVWSRSITHLRNLLTAPAPLASALAQGQAAPAAAAAATKAAAMPAGGARLITMEEVEQHASEESAWFVHEGKVRSGPVWPSLALGSRGTQCQLCCADPWVLLLRPCQHHHRSAHPHLACASGSAPAATRQPCTYTCRLCPDPQVYDGTPFLADHPGGAESILISAGMDATDEFNSIHSSKAKAMLADYYIGDLATKEQVAAAAAATSGTINITADGTANGTANGTHSSSNGAATANGAANGSGDLVALNPRKKLAVKLIERRELSHNVRLFRFGLPSPQHRVRPGPARRKHTRPLLMKRVAMPVAPAAFTVAECHPLLQLCRSLLLAGPARRAPPHHRSCLQPTHRPPVWPAHRQARVCVRQDQRRERDARVHAHVQG